VNALRNIFHECINVIHKFMLKSICNYNDSLIHVHIYFSPPLAGLDLMFIKIVCYHVS